jgi:hypothetical protein
VKDLHIYPRSGPECRSWNSDPEAGVELALPSAHPGRISAGPAQSGVPRQDQVGAQEPATGLEQPAQEGAADAERWVRHDVERTARQSQIAGIGSGDHDRLPKAGPEVGGPAGMGLYGDDTRTSRDQGCGEGPVAGTDVQHPVTGRQVGLLNE